MEFPPWGLWHERHCPSVTGLCTTGLLCVSIWWQKVQVSVLLRCSSKVCEAGLVSLWHASQALTLTGPWRTLKFLTLAWHCAETHPSRGMACVGRVAGVAAKLRPHRLVMKMKVERHFMTHLASWGTWQ